MRGSGRHGRRRARSAPATTSDAPASSWSASAPPASRGALVDADTGEPHRRGERPDRPDRPACARAGSTCRPSGRPLLEVGAAVRGQQRAGQLPADPVPATGYTASSWSPESSGAATRRSPTPRWCAPIGGGDDVLYGAVTGRVIDAETGRAAGGQSCRSGLLACRRGRLRRAPTAADGSYTVEPGPGRARRPSRRKAMSVVAAGDDSTTAGRSVVTSTVGEPDRRRRPVHLVAPLRHRRRAGDLPSTTDPDQSVPPVGTSGSGRPAVGLRADLPPHGADGRYEVNGILPGQQRATSRSDRRHATRVLEPSRVVLGQGGPDGRGQPRAHQAVRRGPGSGSVRNAATQDPSRAPTVSGGEVEHARADDDGRYVLRDVAVGHEQHRAHA